MKEHEESRIERLTPDRVEHAGARATLEAIGAERGGVVPNLFRVAAHRPEIVQTLHAHMKAVMGKGSVPQLLKELISVRVSQINGCVY
jgi:alkylhydroperoxidase family enzyme